MNELTRLLELVKSQIAIEILVNRIEENKNRKLEKQTKFDLKLAFKIYIKK
jgi:hypothetical protein